MRIDPNGYKWYEFWKWDWGKITGWFVVGLLSVAAATALIAGTVLTGGLLGAVLFDVGLGTLVGISGNIVLQGGFQNIGNINPWKVALTGVIGGAIGAATGALSYAVSIMGQSIGQIIGFELSTRTFLGVQISKVFSTVLLMSMGKFVGGIIGGLLGSATGNYMVNSITGSKPDADQFVSDLIKGEISGWIINFFKWLLS